MFRVAALQFASNDDVDQNLATCLRMIDAAAQTHQPELMVLPEFCNHISWYDDREHALRVAVTLEGEFLAAISERAARHRTLVVINCSLRREGDNLTVTSLLYGGDGQLLAQADKQTLMGHENVWFTPAAQTAPVIETEKARLGLYPCRDGVTMETPRCLALRGAQVLCNSLNSFALDEASLHVPARAPENRVFIVAANKVGSLIPTHLLESVSSATFIPVPFLDGAGESQIVAPDGRVLAKGPRTGEAIVVADIDPSEADHKLRPDGTHIFEARRPDLYRPIGTKPRPQQGEPAFETLDVAALSNVDRTSIENAIASAAEQIDALAQVGTHLVVLPELFCFERAHVEDAELSAAFFIKAVRALAEACAGTRTQIVTSLVEKAFGEYFHMGVLIGQAGIVARQPQLHIPARHAWASSGRRLEVFRLPWGKLSIVVGDDMIFPETAKLAALAGAHVLAAPCDLSEAWELDLGLRSRSAENRLCIAMATRPSEVGQSALLDLEREFTIMQPWKQRVFDGRISEPIVSRAFGDQGILRATLHPDAANNKVMSQDTHLLDKRPWWLVSDLLRSNARPARHERGEAESESAREAQAATLEATESSAGDSAIAQERSDAEPASVEHGAGGDTQVQSGAAVQVQGEEDSEQTGERESEIQA